MHYKDEILNHLADRANVAQFVSYSPEGAQRFSRVSGVRANHPFETIEAAAVALLARAADKMLNVRSFDPTSPKSREFVYGIPSASEVGEHVRRLAAMGLYTIVNETIDIHDGGVSGVLLGDLLEFAPDDTPRAVEKPGTVAFSRERGLEFLELVYGFQPRLDFPASVRVEFSLHPVRRGVRQEHLIVWELEDVGESRAVAVTKWPNRFSQVIGDKAFGLIMAHLAGLPVPFTTVVSRRIAPFSFGRRTGLYEPWIRTAPRVQVPGKFTTKRGWSDPFELMLREDPEGGQLASILYQDGVDAAFSGAAIAAQGTRGPKITIEGTEGFGDEFMVGRKPRAELPASVTRSVKALYRRAFKSLGYVRFEWVQGADRLWIVQFHRGASPSSGRLIYPGSPKSYVRFDVSRGLEELRAEVSRAAEAGVGIILDGDVGVTSHFGDVLRKARVPSLLGGA